MTLKDSGNRTEQHNGATRDRDPGRSRQDLLSPFFWEELGVHAGKGAAKYSHRNWERGYDLPGVLESAERHLTSLKAGDDSEDHAIAAAWNLMAFVHIRALVRKGLLPMELAEGYVPLHVVNPVTGNVDHGDGPRPSSDDREEPETPVGVGSKCKECGETIVWAGDRWLDQGHGNRDIRAYCPASKDPDLVHIPVETTNYLLPIAIEGVRAENGYLFAPGSVELGNSVPVSFGDGQVIGLAVRSTCQGEDDDIIWCRIYPTSPLTSEEEARLLRATPHFLFGLGTASGDDPYLVEKAVIQEITLDDDDSPPLWPRLAELKTHD